MGKFEKNRAASLKPGKLAELVLNMLPGRPVAHVEHLGETNAAYFSDLIARANAKASTDDAKMSAAAFRANRERNRKTAAKYAVRHIEATHDDGTKATDADIPEWVDSLPDDVFDVLWAFARNAENFRDSQIASDTAAVAEK